MLMNIEKVYFNFQVRLLKIWGSRAKRLMMMMMMMRVKTHFSSFDLWVEINGKECPLEISEYELFFGYNTPFTCLKQKTDIVPRHCYDYPKWTELDITCDTFT